MNAFLIVIQAVLPVFCLVVAGVVMRRVNWLTEEADASLMRVTINVLAPCLALDSILGNQALENPANLILAPLVGFGTVAAGIGMGLLIQHLSGLKQAGSRRTFAFVVGMYNYGYVPLPLALALFNKETAGMLFVHNVGVEVAMWVFGGLLLGERPQAGWRKIVNTPLIAIVISLALNLAGAREWLPGFIAVTAKMLGQCAIPLGVVLIGATIADHAGEFHPAKAGRMMAAACVLRLGIMPVLFLALARFLPCARELTAVIVLQAAMPAAVFPIVMTKHYGGDTATALRIVMATSLAGLVTIPVWLRLGLQWTGLFG